MTDKPYKSRVSATNLLKNFINHMQIIVIILKLTFSTPSSIRLTSTAILNLTPNVGEAFSIQCILQYLNLDLSLEYFKVIISVIYPLIIVFIYIIFFWNFNKICGNLVNL